MNRLMSVACFALLPLCHAHTAVDKALPSVVSLFTVQNQTARYAGHNSLGSGFVYNDDGIIVTNQHVVRDFKNLVVTFDSGKKCLATVRASDAESDLAIIKTSKGCGGPAVTLGNDETLRQGDPIIVIGNPLGFHQTVTQGIVSALHRDDFPPELTDLIQIDAAIEPGNSGGPLLNQKGEVVGVIQSNVVEVDDHNGRRKTGMNLAIPINYAKLIIEQLLQNNYVKRSYMGIHPQSCTETMKGYMQFEHEGGVLISEVLPGSPAEKAGLKAKDIIYEVDGAVIVSPAQLILWTSAHPPHSQLAMKIWRKGRTNTLKVKTVDVDNIQHLLDDITKAQKYPFSDVILMDTVARLGKRTTVQGLDVLDLSQESQAYVDGLRVNDIITHINGQPISHVEQLDKLKAMEDPMMMLTVNRMNSIFFIVLRHPS